MHNEICSVDSFRQFAQGYGDDNPLYCDPDVRAVVVVGGAAGPADVSLLRGQVAPRRMDRRATRRDEVR